MTIFLDIVKAFGSVDHEIMIEKLYKNGVGEVLGNGSIHIWIVGSNFAL